MKKYKTREKKINFIKLLEIIALSILIVSFGVLSYCIYISLNVDNMNWGSESGYETQTLATEVNETDNSNTTDEENSISNIINEVNHAVVGISKIKNKGSTIFLTNSDSSLGLGTGFIVSEDGYIATNEHVSGDKYSSCYITLENGTTFAGNVVWADSDVDLSLIKINANNLSYINLGDSDELKVAQNIYAIGNPVGFEFQRTVTAGIISGLDRTVKITENEKTLYMEDLIQTDATINPGNSGGPLINQKGNVIGINTVKISSAEGIGFAIPINIIKPVINSLKNNQEYNSATLGVFAYDKNIIPYINQDFGGNQSLKNGVYVAQVVSQSPAEMAGIKEGDILLKIDDQQLTKMSDLRKYIYSKQPGDIVVLQYSRNKKEAEISIKLAKKYS